MWPGTTPQLGGGGGQETRLERSCEAAEEPTANQNLCEEPRATRDFRQKWLDLVFWMDEVMEIEGLGSYEI